MMETFVVHIVVFVLDLIKSVMEAINVSMEKMSKIAVCILLSLSTYVSFVHMCIHNYATKMNNVN